MNILIMTDLEGISGIDSIEMIQNTETSFYQNALERLMLDVNTAIAAAKNVGVERVFVVDGHGSGQNFIPNKLDSRAEQLHGNQWQEVVKNRQIGAYLEIGIHAKAGTRNAFLDHTQSSIQWFDYRMNGCSSGEIAQGAAFTGAFDIPFVMVSGDEAACDEAVAFLGAVATARVKQGVGRNKAKAVDSQEALNRIYMAVVEGLRRLHNIQPFKVIMPLELQLTLCRTDYCDDLMEVNPDIERLDARTVRKLVDQIQSYQDLLF